MGNGEKPLTTRDLTKQLNGVCLGMADWKIVPLGKVFFELRFINSKDKRKVWAHGSWIRQPQTGIASNFEVGT